MFREGNLFLVDIPMSSLWHARLAHLSKADITHLSRAGYIPKLSFRDHQFCEHCQYGKHVAASHPTSVHGESSPLNLVHSDVCGPMPYQSLGGASYFVSFIDDSTRKVWAYPIRIKDRAFSIFSDWLAMVENQSGRKLNFLRTDKGGEFKSEEFDVNTRHPIVLSRMKLPKHESTDSRTCSLHASTLRTIGWFLGGGSTYGSTHNQHIVE